MQINRLFSTLTTPFGPTYPQARLLTRLSGNMHASDSTLKRHAVAVAVARTLHIHSMQGAEVDAAYDKVLVQAVFDIETCPC